MNYFVVGLGNPPDYDGTRHNAGQLLVSMFVTALAGLARPVNAPGFKGEAVRTTVRGEDIMLVPRLGTFMNNSGPAVHTLMSFFKLPLKGLIVIHDDVALPLGQIRFSFEASAGGHNGVKSIIAAVGTQSFIRLRLGVESRQGMRVPPTDNFVLEKFSSEEQPLVDKMMRRGAEALTVLFSEGLEAAMNKFNK
jgi:PTH1 family peptidyl-tRNA hydrolase